MHQDDFENLLREYAADYRRPKHEPLDEMWSHIALYFAAPPRKPRSIRRLATFLASVVAAALILGFFAGRWSRVPVGSGGTAVAAEETDTEGLGPYRRTASRYLGQAAVLLLTLESSAGGELDSTLTARAGELLGTTRLLLDSPALSDSQTRSLVSELEIVLAQIHRLEPRRVAAELELITDALRERDLLPRIHSAVARAVGN